MAKEIAPHFCSCCGETNPKLVKFCKASKQYRCLNCMGECPAAVEHSVTKHARIGHFIFTNAVGMKQSITVRNLDQRLKPITMEVN